MIFITALVLIFIIPQNELGLKSYTLGQFTHQYNTLLGRKIAKYNQQVI